MKFTQTEEDTTFNLWLNRHRKIPCRNPLPVMPPLGLKAAKLSESVSLAQGSDGCTSVRRRHCARSMQNPKTTTQIDLPDTPEQKKYHAVELREHCRTTIRKDSGLSSALILRMSCENDLSICTADMLKTSEVDEGCLLHSCYQHECNCDEG